MAGVLEYRVMMRTGKYRGKDDGMRKINEIASGGIRSRMSRHVIQNAEVALVTGNQRWGGGRQSHHQALGPGGGSRKPSSIFPQPPIYQMGGGKKR